MIVPLSVVPDRTVVDSDYQAYIHRDDHISPTSETYMFVCFLTGHYVSLFEGTFCSGKTIQIFDF